MVLAQIVEAGTFQKIELEILRQRAAKEEAEGNDKLSEKTNSVEVRVKARNK